MINTVSAKALLQRSNKALCGASEREVIVRRANLGRATTNLRKAGFNIIGTSYGYTPTKRIWFIRKGSFL